MSSSNTNDIMKDSIDPEEWKELGNKAFASQNYQDAIQHYTHAILYDSENHIYYSNRSACYAALGQWTLALQDAKDCVRLQPGFVKGYYRLGLALKALQDYDKATLALRQGLAVADKAAEQPNKDGSVASTTTTTKETTSATTSTAASQEPLHKLLRQIQQLQNARTNSDEPTAAAAGRARTTDPPPLLSSSSSPSSSSVALPASLDDATAREYHDLLQHSRTLARDLSHVESQCVRTARDVRLASVTREELATLSSTTTCYRSVGKLFLKTSRERCDEYLEQQMTTNNKRLGDLQQKKDYLERRLKSQQQTMQELVASAK